MSNPRTCCMCGCTIVRNYYRIDGQRYWCMDCGYRLLREQNKGYIDRAREKGRNDEPTGARRLFP
jgi:hypothetical protein